MFKQYAPKDWKWKPGGWIAPLVRIVCVRVTIYRDWFWRPSGIVAYRHHGNKGQGIIDGSTGLRSNSYWLHVGRWSIGLIVTEESWRQMGLVR